MYITYTPSGLDFGLQLLTLVFGFSIAFQSSLRFSQSPGQ